MCLFLQFSERERFHTKLYLSLNKKEKKRRRENVVEKVNLSSVVGYAFTYVCEACVCVHDERRCDDVFRRNPGSTLFYLGFTSDTLNKTSYGRRHKKEEEDDDTKHWKGEHEEEDEHSRASLEDESLSLSLSLFVVVLKIFFRVLCK